LLTDLFGGRQRRARTALMWAVVRGCLETPALVGRLGRAQTFLRALGIDIAFNRKAELEAG
jgi:hypothetical protein